MDSVFYSYNQTSTHYDDFSRLVAGRARELAACQGTVVGIWCDNNPSLVIDLFALWAVDAVPLMLSRRMRWPQIAGLLQRAEATALITSDADSCSVSQLTVLRPARADVTASDAVVDHPKIASARQPIALILHTSGTTSEPKLVHITRQCLEASLRFEQTRWRDLWSHKEVTLGWLPLHHSFGLISELLHIYRSRSHYRFVEAQPPRLLAELQAGSVTVMSSVPWMLEQLLELPGGASALAQLRWVVVGGAPLSDELRAQLTTSGIRVVQQHGMTELGAALRGNPGADPREMTPVIPEQYWHLDADSGELVIHADCPTLAERGPFRTRDAFQRTARGTYRFLHRLDDVLVHVSGEKSNATSIEAMLRARLQSRVEHLALVGAGRLQLAIVLQWKHAPTADDGRLLLDAIDSVNRELPAHSQLDAELVIALGPEHADRFPLSPKGTIVRSSLERELQREIEECYQGSARIGEWDASRLTELAEAPEAFALSELCRLVQSVAAYVKRLPQPEAIDLSLGFAEQGFDSLMALRIRTRLARTLGRELPPSLLFDYPNVERLAARLLSELQGSAEPREPEHMQLMAADEPIAIIGAACRFPGGADGLEQFWQCLTDRRVVASDVPAERWDADAWYDANPETLGKTYVKRASFLADCAGFDAGFFHISPREANSLDPQQRMLLELAWQALEHACLDPKALKHSATGVFVGMSSSDFAERIDVRDPSAAYAATGSAPSIAAGRISYALGLHGPSLAVDTACSSSLSAVHLACQSLRRGECERALVGAANLLLSPRTFAALSRLGVLAADGCSKPFSSAADGFGRGEGAGVIVLARLADAQREGAPILAVIRGSAMNNDGPSSGLTVPNGPAQQSLLRQALASAAVAPSDVDYVECHGTGTLLGDPIEVQALGAVCGSDRRAELPLRLGAVKANIGHLEAAAGLAGLLKVVLAFQHELLPAQPAFEALNPHVAWSRWPIKVLREPEAWPRGSRRRVAGVSSFGLGGTNVHVVLEEPPPTAAATAANTEQPQLAFLLSARSAPALASYAAKLRAHPAQRLEDIAYSLCTTRSNLEHRASVVASTREALNKGLDALIGGEEHPRLVRGTGNLAPRLAMLFTGQGSQRAGMGRELYEALPVVREAMDAIFAAFAGELARPLHEIMFAAPGSKLNLLLNQTTYTQPALFALEVALFRTFESWGIRPTLLLGHSIGELAAAHVAGVLDLADAARLVAARARLMQEMPSSGGMLAVEASEDEVVALLQRLAGALDLAAINGPEACVVSGDVDALPAVQAHFAKLGRRTSQLTVSHAFHSSHMDEMLADFENIAARCTFSPPNIPMVSNVTGELADPSLLTSARYWVDHVRQPVRFADGVRTLLKEGVGYAIELGPQGALTALARVCARPVDTAWHAVLNGSRPEPEALLLATAQLHVSGHHVDWHRVSEPWRGRKVRLPSYPFTHTRYWPAAHETCTEIRNPRGHLLLGEALHLATGAVVFSVRFGDGYLRWTSGHQIDGRNIFPGTAYVEMARAAGVQVGSEILEELTLERPLVITDHAAVEVQLLVERPDAEGRRTITLHARDSEGSGAWTRHAQGRLRARGASQSAPVLESWPPRGAVAVDLDGLYAQLTKRGFSYTGAFCGLVRVWQHDRELFVEAQLPAAFQHERSAYGVHPALLDSVLHALTTPAAGERLGLPFIWSDVDLTPKASSGLLARITPSNDGGVSIDLWNQSREWVGRLGSVVTRAPSEHYDTSVRARRVEWLPLAACERSSTAQLVLDQGADAATLSRTLDSLDKLPMNVALPCWSAGPSVLEHAHAETNRVLGLLQQWMKDERLEARRLIVVTSRAIATRGDEDVPDLAHAPLWGMLRTVQAEFPRRFSLLDVDDTSHAALLDALASVQAHLDHQPQVAIRHGQAYAPRVVDARNDDSVTAPFPSHGTVLVTGAMGTIGGLVARHLVTKHGVKHLLLCSRRPCSSELRESLEAAGANVCFVQCDIGDRSAVRALLREVPEERPLVAVVHTAAALRDAVLADHSPAHTEVSFHAKLDGAWHLHELTRQQPLAAFVLFSSISAIFGNVGQATYSAANSFLDALAHHRRARGLAGMSLAWGFWDERSGLTRHLSDPIISRMSRDGVLPMSTEHALAMLDDALSSDDPLRVPVRLDLNALEQRGRALPVILERLCAKKAEAAPDIAELIRSATASEAETQLLAVIREQAATVLGAEKHEIDVHAPMSDLGLDSVMAVELRNRLDAALGVRLPATLIFEHPSPLELANRIREALLSTDPDQRADLR